MIQLLLALAFASSEPQDSYQYVDSYRQNVYGVPCSIDELKIPNQDGMVCLASPPKKHIYGDFNICTFLVTCMEIKL